MLKECIYYKKWKLLLFSCVVFLLIHIYKFTNYLPNWDSLHGVIMAKTGMAVSGRWFSGLGEIFTSSKYDVQWINGIVSSILVGATIVLLLDLFHIENKILTVVSVFLFAAFPSMASTQNYTLFATSYMLGLFLAVLGVYICVKHNRFFYFAIPCFAFSIGTYQIYILFAGATFIYYFADLLLDPEEKLRNYIKLIVTGAISFVGGFILYFIIDKLFRGYYGIELGSYQGISDAGRMNLSSIITGLKQMKTSFVGFFLPGGTSSLYSRLNIVIALFIVVLVVWKILLNHKFSILRRILLCVMFASAIPITYAYYLVSPGVTYHRLMEIGNYLVYFIPVILFCKSSLKIESQKVLVVIVLLLGSLGIYHFVNDNVGYHQLNMSYERTTFQMTETLIKVDSVNDRNYNKIALIGSYPIFADGIVATPSLTGAETYPIIRGQDNFLSFAKYYLNRNFVGASAGEIEAIIETEEFANMTYYPYGNYVAVINDIIVIKLSE